MNTSGNAVLTDTLGGIEPRSFRSTGRDAIRYTTIPSCGELELLTLLSGGVPATPGRVNYTLSVLHLHFELHPATFQLQSPEIR